MKIKTSELEGPARWVPVDESLPSEEGRYRVKYRDWRHGCVVAKGEAEEQFDGDGFELTWQEECGEEYRERTHWLMTPCDA